MSKFFSITFALIACLGSSASAAPLCMTDTLAGYIGLGSAGCEIGGGTFSGFQTLTPITGALPIAPTAITITPVQSGSMLGLDVTADVNVMSGELYQVLLGYMLMAPSITSSRVTLSGGSVSGGAFVTDIQNFCAGGTFLPGDVTGCNGSATDGLVVLNAGTQQASFAAVSQISVVHDLTFDALGGGSATGGMVMDRFTVSSAAPIPEPQTYALLSSALLAIALRYRMRSRAGQVNSTRGQDETV